MTTETFTIIQKMSKDVRVATRTLTPREARYLVDAYYEMQEQRIRAAAQIRQMTTADAPHETVDFFLEQFENLENEVKKALAAYAKHHPVGEWILGIKGCGPVISAGLLAHIDITLCPTVGHIWSFAGLNPEMKWEKKTKRPWNAALKTLCWKLGESFVKVKGRDSLYGEMYEKRKEYELAKNDAGDYADQAAAVLKARPTHKQKATYAEGKLPLGHIHARCKRYAVKFFLAHLHEIWFEIENGKKPPKPYVISHVDGHTHHISAADAR